VAARVLVKEKIGDPGVRRLREAGLEVDLGLDWEDGQLAERIGEYEGILIRSATKLTADLIERADRLRVIGRAGVGVDNVDVPAATKRGIVVANAPQSNVVTAAEHTMALLLALARNIPQADASLHAGRWDRSKYSGVELYDKTLGILGFGRIGQLVAERARGFGMRVIAYDPYVGAERYRELGVERAESSDELYARADFITIHLPKTPETEGWLDAEAFSKMRDGVRILNVARGPLVVDADLQAALDTGKVAGAALDVFRSEPITEHPLFHYPNVIVTPHLGASTTEATDRAGEQAAEQVIAALTGGVVSTAVNIPAIPPEDWEAVGPYLPLCEQLGRIAAALAADPVSPAAIRAASAGERVSRPAGSIDRVEVEYLGRIAERDDRLLTIAVLNGVLVGKTEEEVNYVNAPALAEERGIAVAETKEPVARDYTDLIRVTVEGGGVRERVVGTNFGRRNRPHVLEAWGQRFNVQLDPHMVLFRYADVPGMVGRVGTAFGEAGINIRSAAVGYRPEDGDGGEAVMVLTTDAAVPPAVVERIVACDGFLDGRTVSLQ
jgi:D-3-phosphoglycerate dehydrogenase / 2-oxoglutarate reductase